MLYGCAQLERAPEAEPATPAEQPSPAPPAQTYSAPAVPPPASPVPPRSPRSARERAQDGQERGRISMYGHEFSGKKTASGEPFDPTELTMAHRTLPFGTRVRVTNVENKRSVELLVNDPGPFVEGRIADVSEAAARALGMVADGVVDAVVEVVAPATR